MKLVDLSTDQNIIGLRKYEYNYRKNGVTREGLSNA